VWFPGFFAFPDYSSFCPKSRERRGQKVPPRAEKSSAKGPSGPCAAQEGGWGRQLGLGPADEKKVPKTKNSRLVQSVFLISTYLAWHWMIQ